jgi:hypothetical protein
MTTKTPNNFFRFVKTWVFVVMLMSFISCIYARYTHSYNWLEFGTVAAGASLAYISLVLVEVIEKKPLFKVDTNIGDD